MLNSLFFARKISSRMKSKFLSILPAAVLLAASCLAGILIADDREENVMPGFTRAEEKKIARLNRASTRYEAHLDSEQIARLEKFMLGVRDTILKRPDLTVGDPYYTS